MPHRAGFWIRVLATMIDIVAMLILATSISAAIETLLAGTTYSIAEGGYDAISTVMWLGYTSFEIWTAATPGKLLCRLRISQPDCSPADFWQRVLRWSTKWLGLILLLLFSLSDLTPLYWLAGVMNTVVFIGCLHAANEDRLSWHDQWAHTTVCFRPRTYQSFDAIVPPPPLPPAQPPPTP